jgi:DNA-binding transcriptional LysR family regulator
VSTRQLRYFVAVAEELNFTRAAAKVYLAQQALSLQIRKLEQQLGARLFERSTRHVELTPAGAALLPEARRVIAAWTRALDVLGDTERESVTLRLGFMPGAALELTGPILAAFERRHPHVTVLQREFNWRDPSAGLGRGLVDVAFLRPPIDDEGLCLRELLVEPRVAGLCIDHPLASRDSVSVAELRELPMVITPGPDTVFTDFWELGWRGFRVAARAATLDEELMVVAAGRGFNVTALSAARYSPRPGVRFVPIQDIEGSALAVGWRRDNDGPLVRDFAKCALAIRDANPEIAAIIRGDGARAPT